MRGPGSWNRRGSEVTPNGYFTVLKSTGWLPTFRLPGGFRYLIGESGVNRAPSAGVPGRQAADQPAGMQTEIALRQLDAEPRGARGLLRAVTLALAGAALTFTLLLWIMHQ